MKRRTNRISSTVKAPGLSLDMAPLVHGALLRAKGEIESGGCADKPCGILEVKTYAIKVLDVEFIPLSPLGCALIPASAVQREIHAAIEKNFNIYQNSLCGKGCDCKIIGEMSTESGVPGQRIALYLSRMGSLKPKDEADCEVRCTISFKTRLTFKAGICRKRDA